MKWRWARIAANCRNSIKFWPAHAIPIPKPATPAPPALRRTQERNRGGAKPVGAGGSLGAIDRDSRGGRRVFVEHQHAGPVRPEVPLQAEMPLVALLGRVPLRVTLLRFVLGGGRRGDQCGVQGMTASMRARNFSRRVILFLAANSARRPTRCRRGAGTRR